MNVSSIYSFKIKNKMDRSSYFIEDKALFGSFPTQEAVNELEGEGVKFFINLTHDDEKKITPYHTKYTYISFPINDRHVPTDWKAFACFLIKISDIINDLNEGELVYIHCKGGHGRSGVVVACLLCYMFGFSPEESLEHTTNSHSKRNEMKERWRRLGSPQTSKQKSFVYKFFENLNFYRAYRTGYTAGFSTFTTHPVHVFGALYPTAEAAIQAMKCPSDNEYLLKQQNARSPVISKNLGRKVTLREDWEEVCDDLLYEVIKCKFDQYPYLQNILINTGLRPIVQHTRGDCFFGDGGDGTGQNRLGIVLTKLREHYYREII